MAESMKQRGTDYGQKGETGEKEPKGVKASDEGGEKRKGIVNGVGMGKTDDTHRGNVGAHEGKVGEYNSGRSESVCYTHKRIPHAQDK